MENAAKALIIAGSILVSILIVSLGVIIYQNVADVAKNSGKLDAQEIAAHNGPFEGYFGTGESGSNVKALLQSVKANNNAANANDEKVGNYIYVVDKDGKTVSASDIRTGKSYTVQVPEGDEYSDEEEAGAAYWVNGYIKTIQIDEYTSRGDK